MIDDTISPDRARNFYDRVGARYDLAEIFESRAKVRASELLALAPGERFLNIGVGTGKEQAKFLPDLSPGGSAVGLDLSPVMARLASHRTGAPVAEADACYLPFRACAFDVLYAAYVLDLISAGDLPGVLAGCHRVLAPGGRMVIVCLTEGVDLPSRSLVAVWKGIYSFAPLACGGCRPLKLAARVEAAGFQVSTRETIVQWGVPSEIILARRKADDAEKG